MSHKASSWLAEIPAAALSGSEFRVLFHLCDAHNSKRDAETACFPSQERLREATGLSNGGLNNALNSLEAAGFILRIRRTVPGAATQRTYYILGFDLPAPQEQTPKNGVGANSTSDEANSTFQGSKLHLSGEYPVSNRKKELAREDSAQREPRRHQGQEPERSASTPTSRQAERSKIAENSDALSAGVAPHPDPQLQALAEWINSGKHVPTSLVTNTKRDALLAAGLVTPERLRQLQIY
jgi:DNA-binding transcriptional MocR family regulator